MPIILGHPVRCQALEQISTFGIMTSNSGLELRAEQGLRGSEFIAIELSSA